MDSKDESTFLGARAKELRKKMGYTLDQMAEEISRLDNGIKMDKSIPSKFENGKVGLKTARALSLKYWDVCGSVCGFDEKQKETLMRGLKVAVLDTSAMLKCPNLIDLAMREYDRVVIPKTVLGELDRLKDRHRGEVLGRQAWIVLSNIKNAKEKIGERIDVLDGTTGGGNNDQKIIAAADMAADKYHCKADIITDDVDFAAYLTADMPVSALHLADYTAARQAVVNPRRLQEIDVFYGDSYDAFGVLEPVVANAWLPDGNTLIISAVLGSKEPLSQRKEKIRWLISQGADVNLQDCKRHFLPPLSHAVQCRQYEMFMFLLNGCGANPNVGSKNPLGSGKVRQMNEGNMPLMIAAWEGKEKFVRALIRDPRTSLNQQDANGFTALIKACANGHFKEGHDAERQTHDIRRILIDAGADEKIVDYEGKTAADWMEEYKRNGSLRERFQGRRGSRGKARK